MLLYAAAIGLGFACSRHLEEEVDAEQLCRDFCGLVEECEPGAPAFVTSCPSSDTPCFDACMDGEWDGDCRFLQRDLYECRSSLTCDEFYSQTACSETPSDDQACRKELWDFSLCESEEQ